MSERPTKKEKRVSSGPDPLSAVNASGFAFQLAIAEAVEATSQRHKCQVASLEHGWRDRDGVPRFIDLLLTKSWVHLVVECKRPNGGQWVFLVPDPPSGRRAEPRRHYRTAVLQKVDTADGKRAIAQLRDCFVDPATKTSSPW